MDNRLERLASWKQQAQDLTHALRAGDDPFMIRVREIIAERGLDPQKMACVSAFDDMLDHYLGILILENGSAIEFELDFHEIPARSARLIYWQPAAQGTKNLSAGLLAAGRELLEQERDVRKSD